MNKSDNIFDHKSLSQIINKIPAESIYDQEVSQQACDAHCKDDHANGVVSMGWDVHCWKWVAWDRGTLITDKERILLENVDFINMTMNILKCSILYTTENYHSNQN